MNREELKDRATGLAARAVEAGIRGDWAAAAGIVQAASDELGGPGLTVMVTAWCDTLFAAQRRAAGMPTRLLPGEIVAPVWVDQDGGRVNADGAGRWAGQVLAARAARDRDMFLALLSVPSGRERGEYVGQLLASVVLGLRKLLEGAA